MLKELLQKILVNHKLIVAPLTACGVSQFIKGVYQLLKEKCWQWSWFLSDGGMPSAHSAMVVALVVAIGFTMGYDSSEFAMALVFALIVLHDAMGVRRLTGKHSHLIKQLAEKTGSIDGANELTPSPVGHTPQEVLAGVLIGVVVSALLFARVPAVWKVARYLGHTPLHHHFGS